MTSVPASTPLSNIRRATIDEWRIEALRRLKASTVNQYTRTLHTVFAKAVEWEILSQNPFSRIGALDEPNTGTKRLYFIKEEMETIWDVLENCSYPFLTPAAHISLQAGLRRNEVFSLCLDHIQEKHLLIEMRTKGRKFRSIPISIVCRKVLETQIPLAKKDILFFCDRTSSGYHNPGSCNDKFTRVIGEAGIKGHWHMLRHTFAARKLSAGVPIYTVSKWLGHSSVAITEKKYGHLIPGSQDHLIDRE